LKRKEVTDAFGIWDIGYGLWFKTVFHPKKRIRLSGLCVFKTSEVIMTLELNEEERNFLLG